MSERFYTDYSGSQDCQWLRDTALRGYKIPPFQSFTLQGNEDCPTQITLYAGADPTVHDDPILRLELLQERHSGLLEYYIVCDRTC